MELRKAVVLLVVLTATGLMAGDAVDFSGTWILDESRLVDTGEGPGMEAVKIVVKQDSGALAAEKSFSNPMMGDFTVNETVTLDGKACVSALEWGEGTRTATAVWSEDMSRLTIKSLFRMQWQGQESEMGAMEIWSLEPGVLKIEATRESPMGIMERVLYYNKHQE